MFRRETVRRKMLSFTETIAIGSAVRHRAATPLLCPGGPGYECAENARRPGAPNDCTMGASPINEYG